ncbi:MAG: transketolase family protein, partial [Proteobacteria bacterium]|nr:transketolase family protein [Pseudomonadota bacterium]
MSASTTPFVVSPGAATRDAFGIALRDLGHSEPRIVVVDGDVANSTRTEWFGQVFPDRFFNVGIAESNMVGVAAGLAASGKIPVVSSFAAFLLCNAYDQLRMSVAFPHLNVKVVGTHAGISIGEDGPSQMAIEDFALACSLPGFTVIVPSDEAHTHAAVRAMIAHEGPVYLRLGRPKAPRIHEAGSSLEIGKAYQLRDGSDLTIVACGLMTAAALEAHDALAAKGIHARVLDFPT